MQILKIATVLLASLLVSTAQADWDHTKWGQSLESLLEMEEYDVETQSGKSISPFQIYSDYEISLNAFESPSASAEVTIDLNNSHIFGTINFMQNINGLSAIIIQLNNQEAGLSVLLEDRYGAPDFTRREQVSADCTKRTHFWRDDQSGNNIRLIDANCTERDDLRLLIYSPILTAENSRL